MRLFRRTALAVLAGGALVGTVMTATADDRAVFAGCVTERTDTSITLDTSGGEAITIDTTWLKPTMQDTLASECLTVSAVIVDGRYIAESLEAGDEPNEVQGVANGFTVDRENRASAEDEREREDDD